MRPAESQCIPTDTVYCLACCANQPEAIKRIYAAKQRPAEKPLSLWVGAIEDITKFGPEGNGWGAKLISFMQAIWPGSVSLVVSRGAWLERMGIGDAVDLIGTPAVGRATLMRCIRECDLAAQPECAAMSLGSFLRAHGYSKDFASKCAAWLARANSTISTLSDLSACRAARRGGGGGAITGPIELFRPR